MITKYTNYDETTKIAVAEVSHMGETFKGIARCHPEDEDKVSPLFAQRLAEARAEYKAMKHELKIKKAKTDSCRQFVADCEQCQRWDREAATAKTTYHILNTRIKEVNDLIDAINNQEQKIRMIIAQHDLFLSKAERMRSQGKND